MSILRTSTSLVRTSPALLLLALPAAAHTNEQQMLLPADGAAGDHFGRAVATDQDDVLVGAPGAAGIGAAYVFALETEFHEQAKLLPPDGALGDLFGASVAIRGDVAVVGAPGHDAAGADAGAAYVFERSGEVWSFVVKLLPAVAAGDLFGTSLALDGTTLLVGAPRDGSGGPGAAYVFERGVSGWTEQTMLLPGAGVSGSLFGASVALAADMAVVGMPMATGRVAETGAAFVFERQGAMWSPGLQVAAVDGDPLDSFGTSVAIFGLTMTIGASGDDDGGSDAGAVYNFQRTASGWTPLAKRTSGIPGTLFGNAVSKAFRSTLIGAERADDEAPDGGAAHMYASGILLNILVASNAAANDLLGSAVAAGGCWQVAGAWGSDQLGEDAGAAYVYVLAHPEATLANGTGINPVLMTTHFGPAVGKTWIVEVDASTVPSAAISQLFVYERLGAPVLSSFGEILVDLGSRPILTSTVTGSVEFRHEILIPSDPFLVGFTAASQVALLSAPPGSRFLTLTNAEELLVGCPEVGGHH